MIVRERPHTLGLFFEFQPSILKEILSQLAFVLFFSYFVVWFRFVSPQAFHIFTSVPFALFGIVISIFAAFRNGASYDRWYEARRAWGTLVIEARSFARMTTAILPPERSRLLVEGAIVYVYALKSHLRRTPFQPPVWDFVETFRTPQTGKSHPDATLHVMQFEIAEALRQNECSPILYQGMTDRLNAFASIQGVCERIAATPAPYTYRLLLHRFVWLLCLVLPFGLAFPLGFYAPPICTLFAYGFFGIDALTEELEKPFGTNPNALPLNALSRLIEVNLLQMVGESNLPELIEPTGFLLD